MNGVRAVIVEDEPHARASLREYGAGVEWLAIVGEAADGVEAVRLIDALTPDLIFLDVDLPEASGLEVLARVKHKPEIVFTTAYDQYAIVAFELGALDYLLKPFGRARFQTMLERVHRRLESAIPSAARARDALAAPLRRLFARTHDGIVPIDVAGIQQISASGDYVEVHSDRGCHLLRVGLAELLARLDPQIFRQVHRSHVINLDAVVKLVPYDARRLSVHLRNGQHIVASRAASEELRNLAR